MSTGTIVLIVVVVVLVVAAAILVPVLRRRSTARGASASAKLPALGQMGGDPNAAPKDHHRTSPADPPAPTV
ncbi:hypothetical protein [Microlunatus flavus]|uniref:Uncharacterized protein n=1 Tax=Microlunatus flavus TaxID=1036181 RepID=A0A1H8Z331_9ACTN|nr:hypothetical protein [Microlunatus flavus]SEP58753.1 hypothetical protein SAMN05421756_10174 [Microlunatus flavus]